METTTLSNITYNAICSFIAQMWNKRNASYLYWADITPQTIGVYAECLFQLGKELDRENTLIYDRDQKLYDLTKAINELQTKITKMEESVLNNNLSDSALETALESKLESALESALSSYSVNQSIRDSVNEAITENIKDQVVEAIGEIASRI